MQAAALKSWMGFGVNRPFSAFEVDKQIRQGLPYSLAKKLEAYLAINAQELSRALIIPHRTLLRRKKAKRFSLDESDRVYRLARVVTLADEILGTQEKARQWLKRPNPALCNQPPLLLLETDAGTEEVTNLLHRFAHGVFY